MNRDQIALQRIYESMHSAGNDSYWGSKQQPYWRPGPNPTVDLIVIYEGKILLIQRSNKPGTTEGGKWAIPGGFIDTDSPKGKPFNFNFETPKEAALRELKEESKINLSNIQDINSRLVHTGDYEGGKRDPRDNDEAWSKSSAFAVVLTKEDNFDPDKAEGSDDAFKAMWFDIKNLPQAMAFDHNQILNDALSHPSISRQIA